MCALSSVRLLDQNGIDWTTALTGETKMPLNSNNAASFTLKCMKKAKGQLVLLQFTITYRTLLIRRGTNNNDIWSDEQTEVVESDCFSITTNAYYSRTAQLSTIIGLKPSAGHVASSTTTEVWIKGKKFCFFIACDVW